MTRWFEEVELDAPVALGTHTFTAEEIVRFASLYDPQYFHLDPEAARHSHFGGLVASGWHTAAIGHRKMVDRLTEEEETVRAQGGEPGVSGPSPGINAIDFKAPVRPGDTLAYTLTVTSKRISNSIPGWGLLFSLLEARNQHGDDIYRAELVGFTKRRDYVMPLRLRLMTALAALPGLDRILNR